MTPVEENKLLKGPFPWRGPGFIVTRYGLMRDLPPSINWKEKAWNERQQERRERVKEVRRHVYEDTNGLSRSDLQATIDMTREELELRWERLKTEGQEMAEKYEQLRDWVAERIRDAHRKEPEGAKWPFSDRIERLRPWNEVMRTGRTGGSWGTQHFRVILRMPTLTTFFAELRSAHTLLLRYRTLRQKRFFVALGSSSSGEYEPSPGAEEILLAVARLDQKHDGLAEVNYKSDIWRLVHRMVGQGELNDRALNRINQRLASDMEEKGFEDRFPETPKELVKLARKHV